MKQGYKIDMLAPSKGALDFSYLLDAPAGKHGFVTARDGHFYFEDGKRQRFLGFNISARSNTPDHEMAEKMAERFASMGINCIRLHAADAPVSDTPRSWASCRKAPLLDYDRGSSRFFNPEGRDRFEYLIAQLKKRGIYLHIDLIVAREFFLSDGLDYDTNVASCTKCYCMFNEKLIGLQKELTKDFLTHVNPYTGLALIDEPAVMTVQINNEDSAIKGTMDSDWNPAMEPFRAEVRRKWNDFLLEKYGSAEGLKKAWTFEGCCALGEEENPYEGTVKTVAGNFYQPANDPMQAWDADVAPVRYADYMEFGIRENQRFYREMKQFLIDLGVKVPIAASNLVAGAADVFGHTDGDVMENNCYFNHPLFPLGTDGSYNIVMPSEYITADPLQVQTYVGAMANTILSMGAIAATQGKPFVVTEWNEYGLVPFHSTSFVHTAAYACLNDWDGLIVYNYQTTEEANCPDDEILSVFDAYNDPSLICQWGVMAEIFLNGRVSPSKAKVELAFTPEDLRTMPNMCAAPIMYLSSVTGMRNVFMDSDIWQPGIGESVQATAAEQTEVKKEVSDADVVVNAGYVDAADLSQAKHAVYYSWSPYKDAYRSGKNPNRLVKAAEGSEEIRAGVHLSDKALVYDKVAEIAGFGNYTEFSAYLDMALKTWGILKENQGLLDGALVSETGELAFDAAKRQFTINSDKISYFSGDPAGRELKLSDRVSLQVKNEKISVALLPRKTEETGGTAKADGTEENGKVEEYLLTALGGTGTDAQTNEPGPSMMGMPITVISMKGKLYVDTLEGILSVKAEKASLEALSQTGEVLKSFAGEQVNGSICFTLDGSIPSAQYRLTMRV